MVVSNAHELPPFAPTATLMTIRPPFLLHLNRTGESGMQRELLHWSGNGGAVHFQGRRYFVAIPRNQTLCQSKDKMTSLRRVVALTACIFVAGFALHLYSGNPYINGVVYTIQRENERKVLREFSCDCATSRNKLVQQQVAPTFTQLINNLPKVSTIQGHSGPFSFEWNLVDPDQFVIGKSGQTIVLFRDIDLGNLPHSATPILAHISSSFTKKNDNCVLIATTDCNVLVCGWTDAELKDFLAVRSPDAAGTWLRK